MNKKYVEDIIGRYVYDVTRRLPQESRIDIDKELRSLIDDMLGDKADKYEKADIDSVLLELGKPSELADKYRDRKRYVIGPELYDNYLMVLKIVLGAVALGLFIANIISIIANPVISFSTFGLIIASLFSGLIQAFGFVTIVFIITERLGKQIDIKCMEEWTPKELPQIPVATIKIKRIEPIIGIILSFIFITIINFHYNLIGVYIFSNGLTIIPIFNENVFQSMLPLINIFMGLSILKEFLKLIIGKYNNLLASIIVALNLISIIFIAIVFANNNIWNLELVNSLSNIEGYVPSDISLDNILINLRKYFMLIFIVPLIIDCINVSARAIKYKLMSQK